MLFLVLISIVFTSFILRRVWQTPNINDVLRWSIMFFLLLWVIVPGLSAIFLYVFVNEYVHILAPDFVQLYVLESSLISVVIMFYLKIGKDQGVRVNPQVTSKVFYPLVAVYFVWVIFTLLTQSMDYQANNDASLLNGNIFSGTISLIYVLLGAFFTYCALTTRTRVVLLISFVLVMLSTIQDLMTGARIGLVWPLFILVFRLWQPVVGKVFTMSLGHRIMALTLVIAFFITAMAIAESIRNIRATQLISSYKWSSTELIDVESTVMSLYAKFNSISTGMALVNGYGAGTAGFAPYRGSLVFFIPRFIYPDKPIAGSINDTYFGTPARLVPALVNPRDTIRNVGVSPLAVSVWHWGWIGGIVAFVVGCFVTLRLLAFMLNGTLLLRLLAFSLIPIPGFFHVVPSPDVALKNIMFVGFVVVLLKILARVSGKGGRLRKAEYFRADQKALQSV